MSAFHFSQVEIERAALGALHDGVLPLNSAGTRPGLRVVGLARRPQAALVWLLAVGAQGQRSTVQVLMLHAEAGEWICAMVNLDAWDRRGLRRPARSWRHWGYLFDPTQVCVVDKYSSEVWCGITAIASHSVQHLRLTSSKESIDFAVEPSGAVVGLIRCADCHERLRTQVLLVDGDSVEA